MNREPWVLKKTTVGAEIPMKRCEYFNSHVQARKLWCCHFLVYFGNARRWLELAYSHGVLKFKLSPFKGLGRFLFLGFYGLADYHLLAIVSETSAETSSPDPSLALSLSHFPAVFCFSSSALSLFVVRRAWPLCPKAMHQCTIVREKPSDHLFCVCLDSKWRCHLHNHIAHLQRGKYLKYIWQTMLNTWCSLCIVILVAAWKVLQRTPPFLKEPDYEMNFKQQ